MADPQKNKQTVLAYYNMAFNDRKPAQAAQKSRAVLTTSSTTHKPPTASRRSSSSWRVSPSSSPR